MRIIRSRLLERILLLKCVLIDCVHILWRHVISRIVKVIKIILVIRRHWILLWEISLLNRLLNYLISLWFYITHEAWLMAYLWFYFIKSWINISCLILHWVHLRWLILVRSLRINKLLISTRSCICWLLYLLLIITCLWLNIDV